MLKNFLQKVLGKSNFYSPDYWEKRYASGGNSGDGSYGRLSTFKAVVINDFLKAENITSAVELGCGDGHQLSIINYPKYTGLDISPSIIEACKKKFQEDKSKSFIVYKPGLSTSAGFEKSELALSLDVLYHVVEKEVYINYLKDLFSLATKYVIFYSTNYNEVDTMHIVHRKFTDDVATLFPDWKLDKEIKNKYPGTGEQESLADFFIFKKIN
jgi:SAM-dependent methyltransferase